jgi:hypothetical protein
MKAYLDARPQGRTIWYFIKSISFVIKFAFYSSLLSD